jgi:hypothetical protein
LEINHPIKLHSFLNIEGIYIHLFIYWPPLWSGGQSSWLLTQRSWVRFPDLPHVLSSSGSWTGSIQPLWG